jgi:CheY-like chemotaxis protein
MRFILVMNNVARRPYTILIADDDPDDRLLAREAMQEAEFPDSQLNFVEDGEDLLSYLNFRGRYDPVSAPRPGLILLDLNMPKLDGREALKKIKSEPLLRRIPVVILTTSAAPDDIYQSYDLGANSFITKPATFEDLVELMRTMGRYWCEFAALPM